ncbi:hypothetical protein [Halonatronum saccharophilum]|uniref:hypothetical protein n=1 Tax=Halonatronum saccharophilum TaxID=150060 RepID=UPI000481BEB3|nr:hypothetical protein [Halonatronum saccharophilum]
MYFGGKKLLKLAMINLKSSFKSINDKRINLINMFLEFLLLFTILDTIRFIFKEAFFTSLYRGFLGSISTAIFFTLGFYPIQRLFLKNNESEVNYSEKLKVDNNLKEAFQLSLNSLEQIKKSKIIEANKKKGVIKAKVGLSWESFGEQIKISIKNVNSNRVEINISSKPSWEETKVDYNKNYNNVKKISTYLKDNVGVV